MDEPLIWWRAIHFAATLTAAGVVIFLGHVAEPAFRAAGRDDRFAAVVRGRLAWLFGVGLGVAVLSGAAWLIGVAQQMSDGTVTAVLWDGIVWIVLTKTGFGIVWMARLVLAALLAVIFSFGSSRRSDPRRAGATLVAASLAGTLAFAGHAAGGIGAAGLVHLTADILHLAAAAAWVGALVPLAIVLQAAMRGGAETRYGIARDVTQRFSTLGMASVAALTVTGAVNGWMLTGSLRALADTDYGRLLVVKVVLFLIMVAIAAVNRRVLTPRLYGGAGRTDGRPAVRRLRDNSLIEAVIGILVIVIVGALGTLPPGIAELP